MREIKFRAWDDVSKCWATPYLTVMANGSVVCGGSKTEILQYTGLVDRNGKPIYDGYICKMFPGFGCEWDERIGVVGWSGAAFWFGWKSEQGLYHNCLLDDHDASLEVIGNIYENKDLLK